LQNGNNKELQGRRIRVLDYDGHEWRLPNNGGDNRYDDHDNGGYAGRL